LARAAPVDKELITCCVPLTKVVSIPVGWWVTPDDREYIVKTIKEGW